MAGRVILVEERGKFIEHLKFFGLKKWTLLSRRGVARLGLD